MSVSSAGVCYCTREDIQAAVDAQLATRTAQIDRIIESESRNLEGLLNRTFAPILDTRTFDWPDRQFGTPYRIWLDANEMIRCDTLTSGGVVIPPANYNLEPNDYGPPYDSIEINLSTSSAFSVASTWQRSISAAGLFGHSDVEYPVGTTANVFNSTDDLVTIANGSRAGVGAVLTCESERVLTLDRLMADTGLKVAATSTASTADNLLQTNGATIYAGETVLVDAEQMYVQVAAGNNLVVLRAQNGSTLATHAINATIYANRQYRVARGALGTTAAGHGIGTAWTAWQVPGDVHALAVAESLNSFAQETSGYARTIGSGDNVRNAGGQGLADARLKAQRSCGRQLRTRVV